MKKLHEKFNLTHLLLIFCLVLVAMSFIFPHIGKLQLEITVLAILSYVIFSLLHHYFDKTLTLEVILEYILIATLTLVFSIGVLS